jgi:hypothetical protein
VRASLVHSAPRLSCGLLMEGGKQQGQVVQQEHLMQGMQCGASVVKAMGGWVGG